MSEPLKPPVSLLAKLGSIAAHAEEFLSDNGHEFDRVALLSAVNDADVQSWMLSMRELALIPEKRQ